MDNVAIILAGGSGTRFNGKKQFLTVRGKQLWKHVYDKVLRMISADHIVVVGVDVPGGSTRSQSVIRGLNYFAARRQAYDKVIILEAARPLVTVKQIETLLTQTEKSASFVMLPVNTVIGRDGSYLNRDELYDLLTPQCFDFPMLLAAYSQPKNWDMTDETRVMYEVYGIKPELILTGENLLKVTYRRDIPIIESLMEQMKGVAQ